MRFVIAYSIRALLFFLGTGAVLRFFYDRSLVHKVSSYFIVATILTGCALVGWSTASLISKKAWVFAAALIAAGLSFSLILVTEMFNLVVGTPWHDFYKDDYVAVFQLIVPFSTAVLSAVIAVLPIARIKEADAN